MAYKKEKEEEQAALDAYMAGCVYLSEYGIFEDDHLALAERVSPTTYTASIKDGWTISTEQFIFLQIMWLGNFFCDAPHVLHSSPCTFGSLCHLVVDYQTSIKLLLIEAIAYQLSSCRESKKAVDVCWASVHHYGQATSHPIDESYLNSIWTSIILIHNEPLFPCRRSDFGAILSAIDGLPLPKPIHLYNRALELKRHEKLRLFQEVEDIPDDLSNSTAIYEYISQIFDRLGAYISRTKKSTDIEISVSPLAEGEEIVFKLLSTVYHLSQFLDEIEAKRFRRREYTVLTLLSELFPKSWLTGHAYKRLFVIQEHMTKSEADCAAAQRSITGQPNLQ